MNVQRSAVVREALTWVGTPWIHAARVKGRGVDCGQFLIGVFANAGLVPVFDVEPYPQDWALHRSAEQFRAIVERYTKRRVQGTPLAGDVVLFRYGRCLSHAALVTEWPRVVHAYLNARAVICDDVLANADLRARYVGAWSFWED